MFLDDSIRHDPQQGILELIGDAQQPQMRGPLEVTTLIGRLIARAANEAQAGSIGEPNVNDVDILAALAAQGEPFRAKPSELATWSNVSGAAITGRVDRLENRGLVERAIDTEDRRVRWIKLTPAGIDLLRSQALGITDQPLFADIQRLSKKECSTLCAILRKLI